MQADKVAAQIVHWLNDYAKNTGAKGFVVGISGGIDSAVASTLAARTGLPVTCCTIPIHQAESQMDRADEQIAFLKENYPRVEDVNINLTDTFDQFIADVFVAQQRDKKEVSLVNVRSRLRMTALYYMASEKEALVLGTGNKVEDFGIGFFTKYGDGGVDLSPIADLNKTEVFELGKYLEVPESILSAAPTDGLWGDDRTDEDQIGASYPELEWAMEFVESGGNENSITERQKEILKIYTSRNSVNQHKMKPIPVCEIKKELK